MAISITINNAKPPRNNKRNIETTKKNGIENNNNDKDKSQVNNPKQSVKQVYILGDSIIKHIKGYTISSSLDNCKVYVKDFAGARIRCVQDYVRPTLREICDHIIIYVGTNDLASNTPAEKVLKLIIDLLNQIHVVLQSLALQ